MDNRTRSGPKKAFWSLVKSFLMGSLASPLQQDKQALADGLTVVLFGPFFGLPILVNYYSLRLLPHVTADLTGAKRRYLREKDFFDKIEDD